MDRIYLNSFVSLYFILGFVTYNGLELYCIAYMYV